MQEKQLKVGITGAEGHIGTTLREGLGAEFKIHSFTLSEESFESTAADLSNPSALSGIFSGLDAVVHLAADPDPGGSWESMLKNNISATYNVLKECRKASVKRSFLQRRITLNTATRWAMGRTC